MSLQGTRGGLLKGLALAVLHLLIVSSLGAKLLYDRSTRPLVWAEATPYDPELPIRGRYVSLSLIVAAPDIAPPVDSEQHRPWQREPVTLSVEEDRLVARRDPDHNAWEGLAIRYQKRGNSWVAVLANPVAFFIPEHVKDPSLRPEGETLWAEVTIPRKGPPRPIRLGIRKGGVLTPLELD